MKKAIEYWGGIPTRVRMVKTVRADFPFLCNPVPVCFEGMEYAVECNPQGALTAILQDGLKLGIKPDECEVIEFKSQP